MDIKYNAEIRSQEVWSGMWDDQTIWTLSDFRTLLTGFEAACPPEVRQSIRMVAEYERGQYDSGDSARLWLVRDEAPTERAERLAKESAEAAERAEASRTKQEAYERAEYARLRAKYGQ